MRLFAVYLGGRTSRSNIEVHDVVFVTGTSLKATYPKLIQKWFGYPKKIPHIDSYIELTHADGFAIELSSTKVPEGGEKLYFINFGGYTNHLFGEIHQSAFYVAKERYEAIQKARRELCIGMIGSHLDDQLDVDKLVGELDIDDIFEIENVDGYHIKLVPSDQKWTSPAFPGYIKLEA